MKQPLASKRILFIGPKTFNYEEEIVDALRGFGAHVDYYNDRPFESNFKKIALRLAPILMRAEVNKYFSSIIRKSASLKYDYVFCIKLECFPERLFKQLKVSQSQAKFIFYTWDSFSNSANALSCLGYFDSASTFDSNDAKRLGIKHRPLFYLNEYREVKEEVGDIDVLFIGSVHIHRYRFIQDFKRSVNNGLNLLLYLYVPSKLLFYTRKYLIFPYYWKSKISDFQFTSLGKKELLGLFSRSKAVLDFCHHNQAGLTMRSLEALGAQRKLITNNSAIKNYDFYSPKNVLVLENGDFEIPDEFLKTNYQPLNAKIYEKYSITGWLKELYDLDL